MHQHSTHVLTFDVRTLTSWAAAHIHGGTAKVLFLAFAVGFAVKVPLFPFHTWLPDAHTDAPTAGSVVLAGVMLKIGAYGFLRFAIPFFPQAAVDLAPLLIVLAVIGITYGAIVAAMQPNLKRIVAYSSVAHLGFVVLGIFALTTQGVSGGLFTMLSHGLTTGALFLLVGMLYDRRHTYELEQFPRTVEGRAGVRRACSSRRRSRRSGCPASRVSSVSSSSLLGAFLTSRWYVVVASTGVILAAVYLLWAVQRVFTGEPDDENRATPDIGFRELVTVVPLLGLSLFLGFYPKPVLDRLQPSVNALIHQVETNSNYKAPAVPTGRGTRQGGRQVIGAAAVVPIAASLGRLVRVAPEIALFGAAIVIVILRSVVRHDERVHSGLVPDRRRGGRDRRSLYRRAMGIRARQRSVRGVERTRRGRRVRRVRPERDPRSDAARTAVVRGIPAA